MSLESFTRAYVECALWSSIDDDGEPLDSVHSADDLAADCASFYNDPSNAAAVNKVYDIIASNGLTCAFELPIVPEDEGNPYFTHHVKLRTQEATPRTFLVQRCCSQEEAETLARALTGVDFAVSR